ncbi:hypothetical protein [Labilithrix luteola]|uniref:hypothetical protein n=1 Tax=Labilithrix luteola TaxID=1391654 RepID=UPI00147649B9|nr:hypothetical protein [Labilithrix luteola]
MSALRRDTDPFELADEAEAKRVVDVELRTGAKRASGRFRFVDRRHDTTIEQELNGPDCEAVARALAMMLALAMHRLSGPGVVEPPLDVAPRPPEPEPAPPPPPPPPAPPSLKTPRASPRRRATHPAPAAPAPAVRLSLDLQAEITSAVVRELLPFASLTFQLQSTAWWLRPSLGLSLRQSLPHDVAVAGGGSTFLWTTGALRVCPHVVVVGPVDLAPCVEAALGRLGADANGLPGARSSANLWADAGGLVTTRWHLSARWFLAASGGLLFALDRTRYELSSGALISETPALGFRAGLGMGLQL